MLCIFMVKQVPPFLAPFLSTFFFGLGEGNFIGLGVDRGRAGCGAPPLSTTVLV